MVTVTLEALGVMLGGRAVVEGIRTTLSPGGLIGIIGPNGAGKSTLVRALLGLVPMSGRASINRQDVATMPRRDIAKALAYLPQGQTLHWPLTVERLVALGRLPHLAPLSRLSAEDEAAIERAIEKADVGPLRGRIATELSGGERARVMLARALAVEAKGLVADEPLASLDPGHQIDVMEVLASEARAGALVIAVLHDLTMAARYCGRLILMDEGRIAADGLPGEVLTPENLRAVYGIEARIDRSGPTPVVVTLGRSPTVHAG